jgi:hypothetical protein
LDTRLTNLLCNKKEKIIVAKSKDVTNGSNPAEPSKEGCDDDHEVEESGHHLF